MPGRVAALVEQCWHRVPGGTATSTVRTLDAIAAQGEWEVVGVSAHHRYPAPRGFRPGIEVRQLPLPRTALYEAWHRARRPRLQHWTGPVDVIHATGGVIPPATGASLVVTLYDLAFFHRPEQFSRRGVSFMTRAFELASREASLVIVPSEFTAADCRTHGIDGSRLRVVPLGVEPVVVHDEARAAVRARHQLPEEFLLWVGTAEPRKNLPVLVEAHLRSGVDVPLILVGPAGWGPEIETIIEANDQVRHIGLVDVDDLAPLYDLATAFVYPSLLEGFGMPVLEAMGQGTPVITSRGTATEEVAGDAAVLIDPTDVDELAAAIHALVADRSRRDSLGSAASIRAAEFTWPRTATLVTDVYDEASS